MSKTDTRPCFNSKNRMVFILRIHKSFVKVVDNDEKIVVLKKEKINK